MMGREMEERMQIIGSNTRCTVYSASYNPRYFYPYRLCKCEKAWEAMRDSAYKLMIDSGYQDEEVSNERIINRAAHLNGNYVFPKDYPGQPDRTHDSLLEFLELYEDRDDVHADVIPVLQPPHSDLVADYSDFYSQFSHLAIGGLQAYEPDEQIQIILNVREQVGPHTHLHGLGVGTSFHLLKAIREYPNFLDSLDVSTAETAVKNGGLPDATMQQHTLKTPYGDDATTVKAQFSQAVLTMVNYMLGSKVNKEKLQEAYHDHTELESVHDAVKNVDVRSRHELDFGIAEESETDSEATTLSTYIDG